MHRLLPILIVLALLFASFTYLPLKRELVYKFGISGDPTTSCCTDLAEISNSNGEFDESANLALFESQIVDYPKTSLAKAQNTEDSTLQVLGTMTADGVEKWIEVDLGKQQVRAWEGNKLVKEFLVSSGKWSATPIGTYNIWYKTRYQRMKGGSKALGTYYNLPNVPNNMFFYKGYALHGAYWHNNFGRPMSHGCVNEPLAEAKWIFDWAGPIIPEGINAIKATPENPGTRVLVHS